MFTRAGFNPRHRVIFYGKVWCRGGLTRRARFIQFMPSGECAWYLRGGGLIWNAQPANLIHLPVRIQTWTWERSGWPRRADKRNISAAYSQ